MARKGNIVTSDNNDNDIDSNKELIDQQNINTNDEDNMDNRFDDVLKVNKNNTDSEIYKKYIEIKKDMGEDEAPKSDDYTLYNNSNDSAMSTKASFYSVLKTPEELRAERGENEVETEEEVEIEKDPTVLEGEPQVMFDLFNLNRESEKSDEANIIQEKKLVNNGKQNVFNENNKAEEVDANREPTYSFQKTDDEVNYQDTFKGLRNSNPVKHSKGKFDNTYTNNSPITTVDLKNKIYGAGFKLRTYQKVDSDNYYYNRYYLSNKLNFDCSMMTAILMMLIVGIMWLAFDSYVLLPTYAYIGMMAGFLLLPVINGIKYAVSPKVRKPATFSFKLSILNAIMVYLLGLVVCLLVAFFAVGADITMISTLVCPLIYPLLYMLVIPMYVIVYQLMYATKRYYIE